MGTTSRVVVLVKVLCEKVSRKSAGVNVMFWTIRFVKGENASEERHSFVMRDEWQEETVHRVLLHRPCPVLSSCRCCFFRLVGRHEMILGQNEPNERFGE
jgi:hypothetical protein